MENNIHLFIDNIYKILVKRNIKIFNEGIWISLEKYKIPEVDLTQNANYYKQFNNIKQALNLFKKNKLFCISYKLIE